MNTSNGIDWRDFISAEKPDGTYRGDINRLGQSVGVCVSAFAVIATAPKAHTDFAGFSLVLAACLAFLDGVAAYAATLRAKATQTQTVTVTEPAPQAPAPQAPAPTKTTQTVNEPATPPTDGKPIPVEIVGGAGVKGPLKVEEQKP